MVLPKDSQKSSMVDVMQGLQATLTQLIKASESQTEAFESLKEDILLNIAGPAEDEEQSDSNRDSRLEINNAGVIERTTSGPGEFISSVFVRPKKDGSHRMILNLKQLNEYVTYTAILKWTQFKQP